LASQAVEIGTEALIDAGAEIEVLEMGEEVEECVESI